DRSYGLLRARQDLSVADATVRLQDLKLKDALDRVSLANLQRNRTSIQIGYLLQELSQPVNDYEGAALLDLDFAADLQDQASGEVLQGVGFSIPPSVSTNFALSGAALQAASVATAASASQLRASFERRQQDWENQLKLATQDAAIGDEQ